MPEFMEQIFDLDADRREVGTYHTLLGSMNVKWDRRFGRTQEAERLMQTCIRRGKGFVVDTGAQQALEAYASSFEVEGYIDWQPLPLRSITGNRTPMNEWLYYSSLARVEKRRCGSQQQLLGNMQHDLACYYLEKSILVWLSASEAAPHIIMDLRLLDGWHRDAGNLANADTARQRRSEVVARFLQRISVG